MICWLYWGHWWEFQTFNHFQFLRFYHVTRLRTFFCIFTLFYRTLCPLHPSIYLIRNLLANELLMGSLSEFFLFFGKTKTIFFKIFFNFLNRLSLLLIWVFVWIFYEFFLFEGILKKLDSIVKVEVKSFQRMKLIFQFEDFLMKKFFFEKPFFLLDGRFGVLILC